MALPSLLLYSYINKYNKDKSYNGSTYSPDDMQAWLNDPKNANHPMRSQVEALAQNKYTGPNATGFDWFTSLFGPTSADKAYSQWQQAQGESWRNLLGQINEYNINTPAFQAQLSKQAGYNTDLSGDIGSMDTAQDNPVSYPDFSGIQTGAERFNSGAGSLLGALSSAFGLYKAGIDLKGTILSQEAQENSLTEQARGFAQLFARNWFQDYGVGVDSFSNPRLVNDEESIESFIRDMDLESFVKKGSHHRQNIANMLLSSLDSKEAEGNFPYSGFSTRQRKRFREQLEQYVRSDDFARDMYNFFKDRESSFQSAVKTASQPIGRSSGALSFDEALNIYKPLYDLEYKALTGDYVKRINDGKRSTILFNQEKFDYDIRKISRDMLTNLKVKADQGDTFSKYLLFTMVTDPQYFNQINSIAGGIKDLVGDIFGIGKIFRKSPTRTQRTERYDSDGVYQGSTITTLSN